MDLSALIAIVGSIVGIAGFAVAFGSFQHDRSKHVKDETKEAVEVHASLQSQIDIVNNTITARLDAIDNGVRDLKADNRGVRSDLTRMRDEIRDEIKEIHDEAKHATELAEAAHRRLDRIGADPDAHVTKL